MAQDTYENKFEPLYEYLLKEKRADFILTFDEIEEILDFGLPRAAHRAEWWDDDTPEHPRVQAQAIHQAGYDSRRLPEGGKVRFRKLTTLPRR
ncbi:MAG: hypothetical protein NTV56_12760 [Alphaproteobacteria bacterium]|nr:hypothetical protein [Alphaproteobacteria bacterium]